MKGKIVIFGFAVLLFGLCLGFSAVYFGRAIGDTAYRIPYLFRDSPAQFSYAAGPGYVAGPDAEQNVVLQDSRQATYKNGEVRWGIVYRSWYDASRKQYVYVFRNNGKKQTCVRSPLFLKLVGRRNVYLAKWGVAYMVLPRDIPSSPQKVNEASFDLNLFDGGCVFTSLEAAGGETIMRVVVPESMQ